MTGKWDETGPTRSKSFYTDQQGETWRQIARRTLLAVDDELVDVLHDLLRQVRNVRRTIAPADLDGE